MRYDECPLGCTSEAQHEAHMAPYSNFPPASEKGAEAPVAWLMERVKAKHPDAYYVQGAPDQHNIYAKRGTTLIGQDKKDEAGAWLNALSRPSDQAAEAREDEVLVAIRLPMGWHRDFVLPTVVLSRADSDENEYTVTLSKEPANGG